MSFRADRLRSLREGRNLPREVLAVEAACSYSSIAQYEAGTVVPPPGRIERLAQILKVPVEYLLDGEVPAYRDDAVLDRIARIILSAEEAAACNGSPSNPEPGTARTHKSTPGRGVDQAA